MPLREGLKGFEKNDAKWEWSVELNGQIQKALEEVLISYRGEIPLLIWFVNHGIVAKSRICEKHDQNIMLFVAGHGSLETNRDSEQSFS